MTCRLSAESKNFRVRQDASRLFRGVEDSVHEPVVRRNVMALEPKKNVGLSAHGTDFNHLIHAEKMGWDSAIHGIRQLLTALAVGLGDGRGMNARGGAKRVATDDWIIRRNAGVRGLGDFLTILTKPRKILVNHSYQ